jgi:hypothetical protein
MAQVLWTGQLEEDICRCAHNLLCPIVACDNYSVGLASMRIAENIRRMFCTISVD